MRRRTGRAAMGTGEREQSAVPGFPLPHASANWRADPSFLPLGWTMTYDERTGHYTPVSPSGEQLGAFRYADDAVDAARTAQRIREDGPGDPFPFTYYDLI